jgi:hypothetical protein
MCLPSHWAETAMVWPTVNTVFLVLRAYMLWVLPSHGRCLQSHWLTKGLYTIISCSHLSSNITDRKTAIHTCETQVATDIVACSIIDMQ